MKKFCFVRRIPALLLLGLLLPISLHAQSFGNATGLMQGERLARVTTLYNQTLKAASDTTSWVPFGTHDAALASERPFAPTRFTLFTKVDTAGIAHAADPSIQLYAEVVLSDTTIPYVQLDGSLSLASASYPITSTQGQSMIVPVYGGGYLRFIVQSADSAHVKLDLWRVR